MVVTVVVPGIRSSKARSPDDSSPSPQAASSQSGPRCGCRQLRPPRSAIAAKRQPGLSGGHSGDISRDLRRGFSQHMAPVPGGRPVSRPRAESRRLHPRPPRAAHRRIGVMDAIWFPSGRGGRRRPPPPDDRAAPAIPPDGRPDWLTTVNVRSTVNGVCRHANTASVIWPTLRSGSASASGGDRAAHRTPKAAPALSDRP